MNIEEFDMHWRLKAIEIASMEMMDREGKITSVKMFKRAKDIYSMGYENGIHKWESYVLKLEKK
tara:strand:+ start:11799 stop:11990 length:192 start_codon:yes stop_codon:yes gene_type:complete